ncbi:chromosome partitioning protein [Solwaraspora sp. WMMD1047]|uniref:MinD/ParA family ATP-binding protein n=1 Tax=Solwaraspora sp. WMMD1047 TaxID=3016102 RepID=UPI0024180051|nr:chromosome partitioning protein [Solwaraspora sp. WMMD1047]MDG4834548.1 chromosome partitioning protein [Solwaraspora sp. WMMD1047]
MDEPFTTGATRTGDPTAAPTHPAVPPGTPAVAPADPAAGPGGPAVEALTAAPTGWPAPEPAPTRPAGASRPPTARSAADQADADGHPDGRSTPPTTGSPWSQPPHRPETGSTAEGGDPAPLHGGPPVTRTHPRSGGGVPRAPWPGTDPTGGRPPAGPHPGVTEVPQQPQEEAAGVVRMPAQPSPGQSAPGYPDGPLDPDDYLEYPESTHPAEQPGSDEPDSAYPSLSQPPGYPGQDHHPPTGYPDAGYPQPGHHPAPGYPQPGYPDPGHHPAPGYPQPGQHPESGHPQPGYPELGYPPVGAPGTSYPQSGPEAGYPQPGQPEAGYPQPGQPEPGYPQPGQPAAGYPQPGHPDARYPAASYQEASPGGAPPQPQAPHPTGPGPAYQVPAQHPELPWGPEAVAPTAEEFARRRATRPADPVAKLGVRAAVNKTTLGLVRLPPGRHEQELRQDIEMVRRNFGGLRQVTVVNPKGGAGKTVAILLLAMTFGQRRGGYVLAWDNNETQGTLGMRAQQDFHSRTVRDMLRDLGQFQGAHGRVGDLSQYVRSQGEGMFDVLASDESATGGEMLTAAAFAEIREVVSRFYKLIFVDTGNNVRAQNWQAAIDATDQLLVTMSARNDSAETAARMLDHLEQSGRQRLVRQAVTVVSMPPSRKELDLPAIQRHFAARTRAVLFAPYERLIDTGEPIRYGHLSGATRDAWLKIAAAVAEGL